MNSGKFSVKTEAEQQIWNECSRLIANSIIYYNTLLFSRVYEQTLAADDQEAIKILRGMSPVAWRDVNLIGTLTSRRALRRLTSRHWQRVITTRTFGAVLCRKVMMGLLSRGSVQSYFYLFEGLGINSRLTALLMPPTNAWWITLETVALGLILSRKPVESSACRPLALSEVSFEI